MLFRQLFDPKLAQYSYLIGCQQTGEAVVVDPERDIDRYVDAARSEGLKIVAVAETHIHADFLSGAREFGERFGVHIYVSAEGGVEWQSVWAGDPRLSVTRLRDGDRFEIGKISFEVRHSPGHTPEHLTYLVTDVGGGADTPMGVLSGDLVFVGDVGRPDLLESAAGLEGAMEPSARDLYHSLQEFLQLPEHLQIWPAHGAGSACGKSLGAVPSTTVGYEIRFNPSLAALRGGEEAFVRAILDGQPEPPLYFARMKRENRDGPRVLGELPHVARLSAEELAIVSAAEEPTVVDARRGRRTFLRSHLPGSLHAPFDRTFNTIVGSYVPAGSPIVLVIDEEHLDEAVRDLVRVGLDEIVGFLPPEALADLPERALRSTEAVSFDEALSRAGSDRKTWLLDVRGGAEFDSGHLPGAVHIAHTRLRERVAELDPGATYLVHCRSGARAASATSLLEVLGFDAVLVDDDLRALSPSRWVREGAERAPAPA